MPRVARRPPWWSDATRLSVTKGDGAKSAARELARWSSALGAQQGFIEGTRATCLDRRDHPARVELLLTDDEYQLLPRKRDALLSKPTKSARFTGWRWRGNDDELCALVSALAHVANGHARHARVAERVKDRGGLTSEERIAVAKACADLAEKLPLRARRWAPRSSSHAFELVSGQLVRVDTDRSIPTDWWRDAHEYGTRMQRSCAREWYAARAPDGTIGAYPIRCGQGQLCPVCQIAKIDRFACELEAMVLPLARAGHHVLIWTYTQPTREEQRDTDDPLSWTPRDLKRHGPAPEGVRVAQPHEWASPSTGASLHECVERIRRVRKALAEGGRPIRLAPKKNRKTGETTIEVQRRAKFWFRSVHATFSATEVTHMRKAASGRVLAVRNHAHGHTLMVVDKDAIDVERDAKVTHDTRADGTPRVVRELRSGSRWFGALVRAFGMEMLGFQGARWPRGNAFRWRKLKVASRSRAMRLRQERACYRELPGRITARAQNAQLIDTTDEDELKRAVREVAKYLAKTQEMTDAQTVEWLANVPGQKLRQLGAGWHAATLVGGIGAALAHERASRTERVNAWAEMRAARLARGEPVERAAMMRAYLSDIHTTRDREDDRWLPKRTAKRRALQIEASILARLDVLTERRKKKPTPLKSHAIRALDEQEGASYLVTIDRLHRARRAGVTMIELIEEPDRPDVLTRTMREGYYANVETMIAELSTYRARKADAVDPDEDSGCDPPL